MKYGIILTCISLLYFSSMAFLALLDNDTMANEKSNASDLLKEIRMMNSELREQTSLLEHLSKCPCNN